MDEELLLDLPEMGQEMVPPPPMAQPAPPPPAPQGGIEGYLQANPNLPRIVRPDGSVIQESYPQFAGQQQMQRQPPDPMRQLFELARRGDRRAQNAYINALQRDAALSQTERIRMQRMQNAIGAISNDQKIPFEAKQQMIRELQTGIKEYTNRDMNAQRRAQAQASEERAKQLAQQNAQMTGMQLMDADAWAKHIKEHEFKMSDGTPVLVDAKGGLHVGKHPKELGNEFDEGKARAIAEKRTFVPKTSEAFLPAVQKEVERMRNEHQFKNDNELKALTYERDYIKPFHAKFPDPSKAPPIMRDTVAALEEKVKQLRSAEPQQAPAEPQNPQAEYDQLKASLRAQGITKADQASPEIQAKIRELVEKYGVKP